MSNEVGCEDTRLRNVLIDLAASVVSKMNGRDFDHPVQKEAAWAVAIGEFAYKEVVSERGRWRGDPIKGVDLAEGEWAL